MQAEAEVLNAQARALYAEIKVLSGHQYHDANFGDSWLTVVRVDIQEIAGRLYDTGKIRDPWLPNPNDDEPPFRGQFLVDLNEALQAAFYIGPCSHEHDCCGCVFGGYTETKWLTDGTFLAVGRYSHNV